MSDEILNKLTNENAQLASQIEQTNNNMQGFFAQLEAHKVMISENINALLQFKTNTIMMQKHIQTLDARIVGHEQTIARLNKELLEANDKIAAKE